MAAISRRFHAPAAGCITALAQAFPMTITDSRGLELTTDSRASAESYDRATALLAGYYADPLAVIDQALAEDPRFAAGYCLRAGIGVLAAERSGEALIVSSIEDARKLAPHANERERRHLAAARTWLDGDWHHAIELYGAIALDHPRDLLALQIAHVGDFYLGQQRMLRDRVARALPHWSAQVPGYGYVLGMLAFGLEETNLFERAEATGREALALERRDPWAVHAVAHVFEMQGALESGLRWLGEREADWAPENGLAYHNYWHMALLEMERESYARALDIFDRHVWPRPSRVALELVDAASLLWRLHLRGVDVRSRAAGVAEAWSDPMQLGYYPFNDAHAAMSLLLAGRVDEVWELQRGLERSAGGNDSRALMSREVGLPLCRALHAFEQGSYGQVVDALLPLRLVAHRFGGSNAQRDVIDQTLLEAAKRSGRERLARAVVSERSLLRRESPWLLRFVRESSAPEPQPHSSAPF
jgi:hypothetical protein